MFSPPLKKSIVFLKYALKMDLVKGAWFDLYYNKIKHDRVKFFRYANLECLIKALAALFLLNIYYLNKTFYSKTSYDTDYILEKIEGFSKIFSVDYTMAISDDERISPCQSAINLSQ